MKLSHFSSIHNSVIHGDCVQVLSQFPSASIDMVLTDPHILQSMYPATVSESATMTTADWLHPAFAQIFRVLKRRSFCISFYGWH